MRRILKRTLVVLGILVVLALLVALLGPRLVAGPVRGKLVAAMERRLNGAVSISGVSLGWFSGVSFRDLTVTEEGASDPALVVRSFEAKPKLWPLIRGDVIVRDVDVAGVVIRVSRDDEGINLGKLFRKPKEREAPPDRTPEPGDEPGPPTVPLLDIDASIRDVELVIEGRGKQEPARISLIEDLTLSVRPGEPARFQFVGVGGLEVEGRLEAIAEERVLPLKEMSAFVSVRSPSYDLKHLSPLLARLKRRVGGMLQVNEEIGLKNGRIVQRGSVEVHDLTIQAGKESDGTRLSLVRIESQLDATMEPGARPSGKLWVTVGPGTLGDVPGLASALELDEVIVKTLIHEARIIELEEGRVTTKVGGIRATGKLTLEDDGPQGALELLVRGDIEKLVGLLETRLSDGLPDLAGTLQANLTVKPGPGRALAVRGRTRIDDFVADGLPGGIEAIRERSVVFEHDFDYGGDSGTLRLEDVELRSSFAHLKAVGEISGSSPDAATGEVRLEGDVLLGPLTALLGTRSPARLEGTVRTTGTLTATGTRRGVSLDLVGEGVETKGDRDAGTPDVEFGNVEASLRGSFEGSTLAIDGLDLRADGARGRLDGIFDLAKGRLPDGAGKISATLDLARLRRLAPDRIPDGADEVLGIAGTFTSGDAVDFELGVNANEKGRGSETEAASRMRGYVKGKWSPAKTLRAEGNLFLDLAGLRRTWLAAYAPNLRTDGSGRAAFRLELPLDVERPVSAAAGEAGLDFDRIGLPGVSLVQARFETRLESGIAEITHGVAKVNGGPTEITGQIDLSGPVPMMMGSIHAEGVAVHGDVQKVVARAVPLFAGVGAKVDSKIAADLEFSTAGADLDTLKRSLRGDCRISSDGGRLVGTAALADALTAVGVDPILQFGRLDTEFRIRDGAVLHDALVVVARDVDLSLSGVTTLDGALRYRFGVRPKGGRDARWRRYAKLVAKDGFLPLELRGTVSSPSIGLPDPGDLLEKTLDGAVDDLLEKGLDKLLKKKKRNAKRDG